MSGDHGLEIYLSAVDSRLAEAWSNHCRDYDFVTVHEGLIQELKCDAVVSPANSFGFMDGGIDAVFMHHFCADIQSRVRRQISNHHGGELIVGAADIVETEDDDIPYLIVAPTMRVPMVLHESVNPYLAARAVFRLAKHRDFVGGPHDGEPVRNHVRSIALPGLGTGTGRIDPDICARQVKAAIDDVLLGQYVLPQHWSEASERHQLLYSDRATNLQY